MSNRWITPDEGLEVYEYNLNVGSAQWACMDMDGTLIRTASGKRFPKDAHDWTWLTPAVPKIVGEMSKNYQVAILTNQSRFTEEVRQKIEAVCLALGNHSILVLVSTGHTKYRKPMTGFWDYIYHRFFGTDVAGSFYVGDAMDSTIDHSNCDLYFAKNAGLTFHFSHYFFNTGDKKQVARPIPEPVLPDFSMPLMTNKTNTDLAKIISYDIILLVGPPAIGKSRFTKETLRSSIHDIISMDNYKSKAQYTKAFLASLKTKHRLIIDNTNPSGNGRKEIIAQVAEHWKDATVCIVHIHPTPNQRQISEYLNFHRCYTTGKWIPPLVYNIYYKNYTDPVLDGVPVYTYYNTYVGLNKYY